MGVSDVGDGPIYLNAYGTMEFRGRTRRIYVSLKGFMLTPSTRENDDFTSHKVNAINDTVQVARDVQVVVRRVN